MRRTRVEFSNSNLFFFFVFTLRRFRRMMKKKEVRKVRFVFTDARVTIINILPIEIHFNLSKFTLTDNIESYFFELLFTNDKFDANKVSLLKKLREMLSGGEKKVRKGQQNGVIFFIPTIKCARAIKRIEFHPRQSFRE